MSDKNKTKWQKLAEKSQREEAVAKQKDGSVEGMDVDADGSADDADALHVDGEREKHVADAPIEADSALHAAHEQMHALKLALKEAKQREQAELHNQERRLTKRIEQAHLYANEKILKALLPIADSLDRALQSGVPEHAAGKAVHEGVVLTQDMLAKMLAQFGVDKIEPAPGDPFDPERHEAMSIQPDPDLPKGCVVQVLQPGYALNGRVIRAAMVMVNS